MHLRRRGNSVQIIKSASGPNGKIVSKPIGSANLQTGEIGAQARAVLSAEEAEQVQAWIARHRATEAQRQALQYRMLADVIGETATWVRTADKGLVAEHADEVRDAVARLRRALTQALDGGRSA